MRGKPDFQILFYLQKYWYAFVIRDGLSLRFFATRRVLCRDIKKKTIQILKLKHMDFVSLLNKLKVKKLKKYLFIFL